ncbi:copper resistance CopC family protein [Tomitella biformata]|uniref:copper resistance CopC family protein n=1 Tax=Tomitella biformata TaxID=630403 RepID=UPI0004B73CC0|nr:copper resistance CopC family protein [Tomitella biformata]
MRFKAVALGLLTGAALVLGAGSASAHASLTSVDPADQSEIAQGPDEVQLTFNEAISPNFATITVVGPDNNLWSTGDVLVDGSTVGIKVGDLGPVGEYKIAYRVTSADGHVVDGIRTFTLTQEGSGTPGKSVVADDSDSASTSVWWIVGAAVVAFAVALAVALRRPKKD